MKIFRLLLSLFRKKNPIESRALLLKKIEEIKKRAEIEKKSI